MAFQPVPEARMPKVGAGRAIPAAPDKLQESLKSPANIGLQSHKPWDTNNPIDRNAMKGDALTNSCSEPLFESSVSHLMMAPTPAFMRL
jgi:hypothetical protein